MAEPVKDPHAHDVLSGRGNFVNYHDGNEHFRKLVRKYKLEYVNCPKQQKGKFSKLIVDAIRARDPPGRFLKQDKDSKLWYDIGEKKALDKTRQALREGAPELMHNGKSNSNEDGDTAFNEEPSLELQAQQSQQLPSSQQQQQQQQQQQHLHNSDYSILQQSIMSLGNDSFCAAGGAGMASQGTFNNNSNMSGIGLSPGMFSQQVYDSLPDGMSPNDVSSSSNSNGLANRTGGMNLSQMIPPPQVHQSDPNIEQNLLRQQQQQQREQEQQWQQQLRLLQQQQHLKQQRQSQQHEFTSQQQEEIIRNATAVMGNDFQTHNQMVQNNQLHIQHQPQKIHMDQLRINRLKEKRKLLEQQILQNQQLEMLEYKKMQSQLKATEYHQQQPQQHPSSSEMRGALQSRLNAVYAGTDACFEPMSLNMSSAEPLPISNHPISAPSNPLQAVLDSPSPKRREPRGPGHLVRENSLKMESVFEKGGDNHDSGGTGISSGGTENNKKKHNASAISGMSLSTTSLSIGFEEESELSALFDTSMKIYTTNLNDQGKRTPPRSSSPKGGRPRSNERNQNSALLGMSLATIPGGEKSSSSMSTDSYPLFDDTAR
eukprot:CAMPEP_0172393320 /NCGR_PEP_ID=MMETSP1061-20121228/9212_1 /TAXON_ID=37318 /ORGANISM="Pseudo-nitzschia pungens, Strain cf. pungens" /LENGTH=598 /DNA_ID=CAMNT_0013124357 /DNA_START=18 /DNA_END=1814 /DNA_ORIENTATION=-